MSWWDYVQRTASGAQQAEIAKAADVTPSTVSRWSTGKQGVDPKAAATFARAYGKPVLEAFVAAEFLTSREAKARPAQMPALDELTDDELLDEIRKRLRDGSSKTHAPGSGAHDVSTTPVERDTDREVRVPREENARPRGD